jgi:hypothetical protein
MRIVDTFVSVDQLYNSAVGEKSNIKCTKKYVFLITPATLCYYEYVPESSNTAHTKCHFTRLRAIPSLHSKKLRVNCINQASCFPICIQTDRFQHHFPTKNLYAQLVSLSKYPTIWTCLYLQSDKLLWNINNSQSTLLLHGQRVLPASSYNTFCFQHWKFTLRNIDVYSKHNQWRIEE